MIVEGNCAIVMSTLSGELKNVAPVFQPMNKKQNQSHLLRAIQFPALKANSDWFNALFVPVVIGWSNYFGIGFPTVI